ncbi:unnamed protein product [Adineta steineri]|uniref:Uncharacterized protein n=1 Tax=Adineta steineri TaxID=433720 RepID=A0A815CCF7_9BILA|nr:unnamed protein product [Adineta steineri]CAF4080695.1 unnamed protein product [Adineta steineri]
MTEKFSEALLPPIGGQVINIPKDIQQLTIKDGTIFIGKEHSHPLFSLCRYLLVFGLLMVFGMGIITITSRFRQGSTLIFVNQADSSRTDSLVNRKTTESPTTRVTTAQMTNREPNMAVLFSLMNPTASSSRYYQVSTVYIAKAYQTTLAFFIQDGPSYTHLDDVSVTNSLGRELLVNGDFENSTYYSYGWVGASIDRAGNAHMGQGCHREGSSTVHNVSQTFYTAPGDILSISFWIKWGGTGQTVSSKATIYP